MKLKAIDIALLPQIARWLVELHLENELPINITLRPGHLVRIIKIEYEEKDREIVNWLLHKMGEYTNYILTEKEQSEDDD